MDPYLLLSLILAAVWRPPKWGCDVLDFLERYHAHKLKRARWRADPDRGRCPERPR